MSNNNIKYVEVLGGFGGETFQVKRTVIIREDDLSGLFRRDWELCTMPVIRIRNTNQRPVNELPVRYY